MSDQSISAPVAESAPVDTSSELLEGETLESEIPTEKPEAPQKRKFKYKADAQEIEEELDDAEIIKRLSLAKGAQSRIQKAAEVEKQKAALEADVREMMLQLQKNPLAVLKNPNLGVDLRKVVEEYIREDLAEQEKVLEENKKTPEQKEFERLMKENEEAKKELERIKKEASEKELQERTNKEKETYTREFKDAIAAGDLPDNPYIMSKFADMMIVAAKAGVSVTPKELIPLVREQYINEFKGMIGSQLPDEVIEEILGGDRIKSLRSKQLARLKQTIPTPEPIKKAIETPSKPKEEEKKASNEPKSMKEVFGFKL